MSSTPVAVLRAVSSEQMALAENAALRRAFGQGDRAAFEALARPHLDTLYTVCRRLTRNATEAEDIAQETLVKVLQRCGQYDPERAFRPWLLKAAVNLCRDRVRSVWWRRVVPIDNAPLVETRADPEAQTAAGMRDALVRDALGRLPRLYQEALALYHVQDLSYAEVSEVTGVAIPALKQRVRRGSALLRAKVEELYPELLPIRRSAE